MHACNTIRSASLAQNSNTYNLSKLDAYKFIYLSDQLHGAIAHAKTRAKTRDNFFAASNCDQTPKRRYWLLLQLGAKFVVANIL